MNDILWNTINKNNHYYDRYLKFINHYATSPLPLTSVEKHHIIPTSLGGTNEKKNLINLPIRAHLIAHMLLWKAFPRCIQMAFAIHQMTTRIGNLQKSSKIYESIKITHSHACSIRNTGRILSQEWKESIREGHKNYDHSHLKTPEARTIARERANTLLKQDAVIKKRQQTMRDKGDDHASKRNDVRAKIGRSHQSLHVICISPTGETFHDPYLTQFAKEQNISLYVIKKYVDLGRVPSPSPALLARWDKTKKECDSKRITATGWEFRTLSLS